MRGMVFSIDLGRCVGCHACRIACKDRANLPDNVDLLRVTAEESGTYPTPTLRYRVSHCFHCEDAPCVPACPEGALARRADGLVTLDGARCTGCGACLAACPLGAIVIGADGVVAKCDACVDETAAGLSPTCVRACPLRALEFEAEDRAATRAGRVRQVGYPGHDARPRVRYWVRSREPVKM